MPKTELGKATALNALQERRENRPEKVDNSSLRAGSPMYYYCKSCGHLTEVLPECHWTRPKHLCDECQALKDLDWLE